MALAKNNDAEFYIGWMPQAPGSYAKHVRQVVIALAFLVAVLATILAIQQREFSTASFEFGQLTHVAGIYQSSPVPAIRVANRTDVFGHRTYMTIPLVGYGKFGADGVMRQLEKEHHTRLDGQKVTMAGTLLYSDGKTFLQVDGNDKPLVSVGQAEDEAPHAIKELGTMELTGEVLDPKCYFGVMKPGQGKPHRDCAIRCIAGGITPVFLVKDGKGATGYYMILDENGNKMNDVLKDHVAEPISLQAKAVQYDDWIILYASKQSIRRTGGISWFKARFLDTLTCAPVK
jgi:hypothetical protein